MEILVLHSRRSDRPPLELPPLTSILSLFPGLTSGSYSAQADEPSLDAFGGCVPFTVMSAAPPIPEYPLGLPLLAILTVIAYGLIRRRTRNDHD